MLQAAQHDFINHISTENIIHLIFSYV